MRAVRRTDTTPEIMVRQALHRMGLRFRLHRKNLPGTPDIVLPKYRIVIFVHGCFWHRHPGCAKTTDPKTRADFWQEKFRLNIERDERNVCKLKADGWRVLTLWECSVKDEELLKSQLRTTFFGLA